MRILEYADLDASGLEDQYERTRAAIARGDFRAAEVKKLEGHKGLYRAKLDRTDRLIFSLVKHRDEVCALMLEVIRNHDYDKSRFLRGAAIDESKLPRARAPGEAAHEAAGACATFIPSAPRSTFSTSRSPSMMRRRPSTAFPRR